MGSSNSKPPSYEEVLREESRLQEDLRRRQNTNQPHKQPRTRTTSFMEDKRSEKEVKEWIREVLLNSDHFANKTSKKWTRDYIEDVVEMWEGNGQNFEKLYISGGDYDGLHRVFEKKPFAVFYLVAAYRQFREENLGHLSDGKNRKAIRELIATIMVLINTIASVWLTLAVSVLKPAFGYWSWVGIGSGFTVSILIQFLVSLWADKPEAWQLICWRGWPRWRNAAMKKKQPDPERCEQAARVTPKTKYPLPVFPSFTSLTDRGRRDGLAVEDYPSNYLLKHELQQSFDRFLLPAGTIKRKRGKESVASYEEARRFCDAKIEMFRGPETEDYTK